METNSATKRFELLVAGYLASDLTPSEREELLDIIKSNARLRALFIEEIESHELLRIIGQEAEYGSRRAIKPAAILRMPHKHRAFKNTRRNFAVWAVPFAACVLLTATLIFLRRESPQGQAIAVLNDPSQTVITRKQPHNAADKEDLYAGDSLATGAKGKAAVSYADHTRLDLSNNTAIRLETLNGAERVVLNQGQLFASVAKHPADRPMVFVMPQAKATVLGTELLLSINGDANRLEVVKGEVRLEKLDGSAAVLVASGHCAVAAPGVKLEAVPVSLEKTAAQKAQARPVTSIFRMEFDALGPDHDSPNMLVRLREAEGEVTAIASEPCTGPKSAEWAPDVRIHLARSHDDAKELALYSIPKNVEIRFRIKSEKPGKIELTQTPSFPRFPAENFYSGQFEIGPEWKVISVRGGQMKPYRRADEGSTRDLLPGTEISRLSFYGYGVDKFFLNWCEVLSAPAEDGVPAAGQGLR